MKRGDQVVGPYWLVVARNVLHPDEIKYFLSNASAGVPLEVILHVAFRRWPVERCLEDEKTELGLGHFEVRKYGAIVRHLRITQVSHLFLARQTERLRKKNPEVTICQVRTAAHALLDALPLGNADRGQRLARTAEILQETQHDIAKSRASHTKGRLEELRAIGINVQRLRCYIPPPSG